VELRSPIRLYWDITPIPESPPDYGSICSELAGSRALTLHITDLGVTLSTETSAVVSRFAGSPLLLLLTVSHRSARDAAALLAAGVKKLFVDVLSPDDIQGVPLTQISGISFRTSRENHYLLPEIIEACLENGVAELQLPMERLMAGAEPLCLTVAERELLAARVAAVPFSGKMVVTANDPFLWRVVHPALPFPDGICQAANTMLAIAPNGDVYPCPAMPILLGNLQNAAFRDIVSSRQKKELRASIVSRPSACLDCPMIDDCRGGCRGRGHYVQGTLDGVDPACDMG
jgi:GeoRSP system SPASM domain protein